MLNKTGRAAILIWLGLVIACLIVISRSQFTADLSAFLPSRPTAEQQLLMDQLKDGLASRLILVGITGLDDAGRADISKAIANKLRNNPAFVTVNNGESTTTARDQQYLFNNRYLLSPAVNPARFSVEGLHHAISDSIDEIASPAGLLFKTLLPQDPTGEMLQLLDSWQADKQPQLLHGVWASADGSTALLLMQTRALGADTDAQKQAMQTIQAAFSQALAHITSPPARPQAKLEMTGPGVFSVLSRDTIKQQVRWIFIISSLLIAGLLLAVYRSLTALMLGFLPVVTGILAGIAVVSLGFGVVHGITLGFGTALIGEAVDYAIYLFMQSGQTSGGGPEQNRRAWITQVWPTVRLGVFTSVFGFAALLLSGFPGLAQLGLYSVAGLTAAALMTRYVLPHLLSKDFKIGEITSIGRTLARYAQEARRLRVPAMALIAAAGLVVYLHHQHLWSTDLSTLNPVSAANLALDAKLRADMGAPDARYVVVVSANSQEAVLQRSEKVARILQGLIGKNGLSGFDSASRYLPSIATQRARRASLPPAKALQSRLTAALEGLPLHLQTLKPFLAAIAASRQQPLLQRADLQGTAMAMAVDAMLLQQGGHWSALIPLTASDGEQLASAPIRDALSGAKISQATLIDMKAESDQLYAGYMHEAIVLSLIGLLAIVLLLGFTLRSPARVLAVIAPLAAAVLVIMAGLALIGQQLMILHLIGLLLIVAIGSNYALFFNPPHAQNAPTITPSTYASLLFANVATVLGFGLLTFSTVPVLQAMGMTVAPGVIFALLFAAIFARDTDDSVC